MGGGCSLKCDFQRQKVALPTTTLTVQMGVLFPVHWQTIFLQGFLIHVNIPGSGDTCFKGVIQWGGKG